MAREARMHRDAERETFGQMERIRRSDREACVALRDRLRLTRDTNARALLVRLIGSDELFVLRRRETDPEAWLSTERILWRHDHARVLTGFEEEAEARRKNLERDV